VKPVVTSNGNYTPDFWGYKYDSFWQLNVWRKLFHLIPLQTQRPPIQSHVTTLICVLLYRLLSSYDIHISYTVLFFCRSCLSVCLSTKSTKFGSRYLLDRLSEGDNIDHIGSPGIAVYRFYSAPQCSHCKRCISYGNSVRPSVCLSVSPSVTRRYCVKTRHVARCSLHCRIAKCV